jgi:hypothetical protein
MKVFSRIPLYIGLGAFIMAVTVSAVKVGQGGIWTNTRTQATLTGAKLAMQFVPPGTVSVLLFSDKPVAGADVTVKYDKSKMTILPSSLSPGQEMTVTGGIIDEIQGTFSFSAVSKSLSVKDGIIGTFTIAKNPESTATDAVLDFLTGEGESTVLEQSSGDNILIDASSVPVKLNGL